MSMDLPVQEPLQVRQLILVEGRDDAALMRALCVRAGLQQALVHEVNGKGNFPGVVSSLTGGLMPKPLQSERKCIRNEMIRAEDLTHLVLVADADASAEKSFRELTRALAYYRDGNGLRLPLPDQPLTWSEAAKPLSLKTGIVILPVDQPSGTLEDLIIRTLQPNVLACLDGLRACLKHPDEFTGKQQIQLYLGASAREGRRFADSFGSEDAFWPLDHPCFGPLVDFLKSAAAA